MRELDLDIEQVLTWFPHETETPYILVRVPPEEAATWAERLVDVVRRCYVSDELLRKRAQELEEELQGTTEFRQSKVIDSKLPDRGAVMAGDFGEILTYFYQSAKAQPQTAFGPKKWRLKQDKTKAAPYSDVVQFILPTWPTPSVQDEILCAEVKTKTTDSHWSPIGKAIEDCNKDRTSRLAKTLQWLKARAIGEPLGNIQIAHLDRFINATDHPQVTKRFRAVVVICSSLLDAELFKAPAHKPSDYSIVIVAVPNLYQVYNAVFDAVRVSVLPEEGAL